MNFNDYQEAASRTAKHSVDARHTLTVLALGLSGESGEVAEHIKKYIGHGHSLNMFKVAKELGDVLWYVAMLASYLGYTLEDIAEMNIEKLQQRYPEGFSVEASRGRRDA